MPRDLSSALTSPALAALLLACHPVAGDEPIDEPRGCTSELAGQIDLAVLERHLLALADLGHVHAGNRAAGSGGFDASADYVAAQLLAAGLEVRRETFGFDQYVLREPPRLRQVAPAAVDYAFSADFRAAHYSGNGDVEGPVIPVDLALGHGNNSTSGCEPADFAGFFPRSIALLQRGGCPHQVKVDNAIAAGAAALVYFNQGDIPQRSGHFTARLDIGTTLPVLTLPYALGEALAGVPGLELHLVIAGDAVVRHTVNVIADTPPTASGRVIMLGAHLDSVAAGPGINDNGSGVAALLGIAGALPTCDLRHQVRFGFWGAEELGLLGSTFHVANLGDDERAELALYLNLDMVASPNPVRFIYDGDGSEWGKAGPDGSGAIEAELAAYFDALGVPTQQTPFDGRSDYWGFIHHDIPAGGLFTGAEARKSAHEAELFGGDPDVAYDPCYHAACDDRNNYSPEALLDNTRAAAHVTEIFAMSDPLLPPAGPAVLPRAARHDHPPAHCDDQRQ